MSQKVKNIYAALRTRLQQTKYAIVQGRQIDATSDLVDLPAIAIFDNPKSSGGIQSDEGQMRTRRAKDKSRETLHVIVEAVDRIGDITFAREELEDLHTVIAEHLFDADDTKLGGLARDDIAMDERHAFVPDPHENIGKIQIHLSIPYVEDI